MTVNKIWLYFNLRVTSWLLCDSSWHS